MKPPSSFKSGGAGRPPSDRGPSRSGGPSSRTPDRSGSGAPRGAGPGGHGGGHGGPQGGPHGGGGRDKGPRPQGARPQGPRSQGDRPQGDRPHSDRPYGDRPQAPRPQAGDGPRPPRLQSGPGPQTLRAPASARDDQRERPRDQDGYKPRGDFRSGPKRDGQKGRSAGPRPPRDRDEAPRHAPDAPKGAVWLYGHHAIAAALANPARRLRHLMLTEEAETVVAAALNQPWPIQPERTDRARLDQLLGRDVVHQGAALLADPLPQPSLQSVLEQSGPIVVLDQVSDPRNVGAILRSAAAFGAAAVIVQDRNAPDETGALAKAASGALEVLPLIRAVNITRTLIALKAANIWCIGLDAHGQALSGPSFAGRRIALVLGAEGDGMRRLTRETCDEVLGLSIKGVVESLNVSAAAAVALYELTRP